MTILRLLFALILLLLVNGAMEYEIRLREDWGGLFVGRMGGRKIEVNIARYRPGRCYVLARSW